MTPRKESSFADFLREEDIIAGLRGRGRNEVVEELVDLLHRHGAGFDREAAVRAILEREEVSPTVVAPGVALPHARLEGLSRPRVAVGTSAAGVDFGTTEGGPVHVVVLMLAPKADPGAYLRLLAAASKVLADPQLRSRLAGCTSSKEAYGTLTAGTVSLPTYLAARNVMDVHPVTLRESNTLAETLQTFFTEHVWDVPVVDEEGDLRGVVALEDVLRMSFPPHFLWMEDLSSILHFQPFSEVLRKDRETKVADFMRERYVSVRPDTPAIELAKLFLAREVRQIQVLEGRRLVGVVNLESFMAQVFWA